MLAGLAMVCVALELAGSFGFSRASRIQHRIDQEHASVAALQAHDPAGRPTLLAIGNSLPVYALDVPLLRQRLQSRFAVSNYFIEQTAFTDWYYGVRRLLAEGSRPRVILLVLGTGTLADPGMREEFFARFMLRTADLPDLASRMQLHPTRASNLLFANLSGWFGAKADIRKFVLLHTLPPALGLVTLFAPNGSNHMDVSRLRPILEERLTRLRQSCEEYGVTLVVAVPPTGDAEEPSELDQEAGRAAHVPLLVPIPPPDVQPDYYEPDHYHLAPKGRSRFTEGIAVQLAGLAELQNLH